MPTTKKVKKSGFGKLAGNFEGIVDDVSSQLRKIIKE